MTVIGTGGTCGMGLHDVSEKIKPVVSVQLVAQHNNLSVQSQKGDFISVCQRNGSFVLVGEKKPSS